MNRSVFSNIGRWALVLCVAVGCGACIGATQESNNGESQADQGSSDDAGADDARENSSESDDTGVDDTEADDAEADDGGADDARVDGDSEPPPDAGTDALEAPFGLDDGFADSSWLEDADLDVVKVTNLDNDGEGSLPWALDQNGPKVVVFEVGGVIDMEGQTYVRSREPETYIAGQTAPSPGITINRGGLRIHGDKTIVRHIRVRVGDEINDPGKARSFTYDDGVSDVIIDHVSAAWHTDQGVGVRSDVQQSTLTNSLISEGLCYSVHPEQPHCRAILIHYDAKRFTSAGNIFSHHRKRHPYAQGGSEFVWVNNYIYNHGFRLAHLGSGSKSDVPPETSFVGNVYEMGEDSPDLDEEPILIYSGTAYYEDNVSIPPGRPDTSDAVTLVDDPPLWPQGLTEMPSEDVKETVLETAGARPADRSPQDQRMIEDMKNNEGSWVDSQEEVGGYPELESTERQLDVPDSGLLEWLEDHARAVEDPNIDPPE